MNNLVKLLKAKVGGDTVEQQKRSDLMVTLSNYQYEFADYTQFAEFGKIQGAEMLINVASTLPEGAPSVRDGMTNGEMISHLKKEKQNLQSRLEQLANSTSSEGKVSHQLILAHLKENPGEVRAALTQSQMAFLDYLLKLEEQYK